MYCAKCGTELRSGDMFCPKCGEPLKKQYGLSEENKEKISKEHIFFDWDALDFPSENREKKDVIFNWGNETLGVSKKEEPKHIEMFKDKSTVDRATQELEIDDIRKRAMGLREDFNKAKEENTSSDLKGIENTVDEFKGVGYKTIKDLEDELFNSYVEPPTIPKEEPKVEEKAESIVEPEIVSEPIKMEVPEEVKALDFTSNIAEEMVEDSSIEEETSTEDEILDVEESTSYTDSERSAIDDYLEKTIIYNRSSFAKKLQEEEEKQKEVVVEPVLEDALDVKLENPIEDSIITEEEKVNDVIEELSVEESTSDVIQERLDDRFLTFNMKNDAFDELLRKEKEKVDEANKKQEFKDNVKAILNNDREETPRYVAPITTGMMPKIKDETPSIDVEKEVTPVQEVVEPIKEETATEEKAELIVEKEPEIVIEEEPKAVVEDESEVNKTLEEELFKEDESSKKKHGFLGIGKGQEFTQSVAELEAIAKALNDIEEERKNNPTEEEKKEEEFVSWVESEKPKEEPKKKLSRMTITGLDLESTFDFSNTHELGKVPKEVIDEDLDKEKVTELENTLDDFYRNNEKPVKKHTVAKIIIIILVILVLLEAVIVLTKYFAPESAFGLMIDEYTTKFFDLLGL